MADEREWEFPHEDPDHFGWQEWLWFVLLTAGWLFMMAIWIFMMIVVITP